MATLTVRATGPAAAAAVWEAYADPQRWPQWSPHIRTVEAVGRLRPGLKGQVRSYVPPAVRFEVLDVDAKARRWSWEAGLGPLRLGFDHGVDPRPAGSAAWITMRGPLAVLVLYSPVAKLALFRLTRAGF